MFIIQNRNHLSDLYDQPNYQKMFIDDKKTVLEIQSEFSSLYSGLKLEFYKREHQAHEGSRQADQYHSGTILSDIRDQHKSGELTISNSMTTAELESSFESKFGLHVQVFRRSGSLWLQTSATDDWSLQKQHEKSRL